MLVTQGLKGYCSDLFTVSYTECFFDITLTTLTLFHPRCYRMCPVCRKPSAFVTPVSILPLDFSDPGILQECQKLSRIAFAISLVLLCFSL